MFYDLFYQSTPSGKILPVAAKVLKQNTLTQPGAFEDFVKVFSIIMNKYLNYFISSVWGRGALLCDFGRLWGRHRRNSVI